MIISRSLNKRSQRLITGRLKLTSQPHNARTVVLIWSKGTERTENSGDVATTGKAVGELGKHRELTGAMVMAPAFSKVCQNT
jgi:hypothetical protein